jgi:hypothetical protein
MTMASAESSASGWREAATGGRIDGAIRPEAEKHGAFEAVTLAEELAKHGHGLLAAIFLITREQNDVLAFGLTGGFINDMVGGDQTGCGEERK